jgi:hypothetical protein
MSPIQSCHRVLRMIGHGPDDIGIRENFKPAVRPVFPDLPFVGQGRIFLLPAPR